MSERTLEEAARQFCSERRITTPLSNNSVPMSYADFARPYADRAEAAERRVEELAMENEALNQRIRNWVVGHQHVWDGPEFALKHCTVCRIAEVEEPPLPDYTRAPSAMLELAEAVRVKGFDWEIGSHSQWMARIWHTEKTRRTFAIQSHTATADTLPLAVALAVEKLIDSEGK